MIDFSCYLTCLKYKKRQLLACLFCEKIGIIMKKFTISENKKIDFKIEMTLEEKDKALKAKKIAKEAKAIKMYNIINAKKY